MQYSEFGEQVVKGTKLVGGSNVVFRGCCHNGGTNGIGNLSVGDHRHREGVSYPEQL